MIVRHRGRRFRTMVGSAAFLAGLLLAGSGVSAPPERPSFANPVSNAGTADPWIVRRGGFYYFTFTGGRRIEVWRSPTLAGLGDPPEKKTVWTAPRTGPNTDDVWAPELHYVRGKWYLYYCATGTPNGGDADENRRIFCLEGTTQDPLGNYLDRGKVTIPSPDEYAIDPTVAERNDGSLYLLWSGRSPGGGGQRIRIAPMSNPWTVSGPAVTLSSPELEWERQGWPVNEGPEVLQRGGQTFVVYSASGYTTPGYCLGLLTNSDGKLLDSKSWAKSLLPVFTAYHGPEGDVYSPGHCGLFQSPDGREDWIVYHARNQEAGRSRRTARAQRFYWSADGRPLFGHPIPLGVPLDPPSGETGTMRAPAGRGTGLRADYFPHPDLTGRAVSRNEPRLHFDWGLGSPAMGLPPDHFSARWRGEIQPRFSEQYTFQTYSDDGVRVWVEGRKVIDNWTDHAPTSDRGTITLQAGRRYPIVVEYYDNIRGARVMLEWSSPSQRLEVVPTSQLYPAAARRR